MTKLDFYGLKSCDTCKKALRELKDAKTDVAFHDVRDEGVTKKQIEGWAKEVGWEKLLNRASTTWRNLPDSDKENVGKAQAITLMQQNPTLIKRPVIQRGDTEVYVGWSDATKKAML